MIIIFWEIRQFNVHCLHQLILAKLFMGEGIALCIRLPVMGFIIYVCPLRANLVSH